MNKPDCGHAQLLPDYSLALFSRALTLGEFETIVLATTPFPTVLYAVVPVSKARAFQAKGF